MATRISFSTHYPDRMKELAGKPTRFPEKLITMIDPYAENEKLDDLILQVLISGVYDFNFKVNYPPKTTTIRKNYEYWKSKEGQLIQPFFWAGKPYHSKQVVFCPAVRLARVRKVEIRHYEPNENANTSKWVMYDIHKYGTLKVGGRFLGKSEIKIFTQNEGFDDPDHFWMWFDKDFDGAYLELESVRS